MIVSGIKAKDKIEARKKSKEKRGPLTKEQV